MLVEQINGINPQQFKSKRPALDSREQGQAFDKIKKELNGSEDFYTQIRSMERDLASGKELSSKEILLHQIRAQHFHLRVELVSKVAESALATVRKFQNPQ